MPDSSLKGSETILVTDDEPLVLKLAKNILQLYGYRVVPASGGEEALQLFRKQGDIDLVLTDVVMPNMSGPQLVHKLKEVSQGLRCVFMSGFDQEQIAQHGGTHLGCDYLRKPFTPDILLRKIRSTLDARGN